MTDIKINPKTGLPQYVSRFPDRHGKTRLRFRKTGQKDHYFNERFPGKAFWIEYDGCLSGSIAEAVRPGEDRVVPGSIADLIIRFYKNPLRLGPSATTQYKNRRILELFRERHGQDMVADLRFEHVDAIIGEKAQAAPFQARKLKRILSKAMVFAVRIGMRKDNPVEGVENIKAKSAGYHSWSEDEITQFVLRHPIGTKPHLAMMLILWTFQRRGDATRIGQKDVINGRINIVQQKTGKELFISIAPQLQAAISAMKVIGTETFLITEYGKPFSKAGFGNWFRDRCNEAALPQCSAHGLRKAAARRAAQLGFSNQALKAAGGWSNDSEVSLYTASADQMRLADGVIGGLAKWDLSNLAKADCLTQEDDIENEA